MLDWASTSWNSMTFADKKLQYTNRTAGAQWSSLWAAGLRRGTVRSKTQLTPDQPKEIQHSLPIFPYSNVLEIKWPNDCDNLLHEAPSVVALNR